MKKHENIVVILSLLAVVILTAVASGFAYAYARSQHVQDKCPCDATIVEMANKKGINHYYAACYIEREIRLNHSNGDLEFVKACRKWHAKHEF